MRIGVLALGGAGWLGGTHYASAVAAAAAALGHDVTYVDLPGSDGARDLEPAAAVLRYWGVPNRLQRVVTVVGGALGHRRPDLERAARKHGLQAILPVPFSLGRGSSVPWIGWIPDFQHMERPEWFSRAEFRSRDRGFRRLVEESPRLILSSDHAAGIAGRWYPGVSARVSVLRFAAAFESSAWDVPVDVVEKRYEIREPFIYVPNQFWIHKNHRVVFDAWAQLGEDAPLLVCSGNTGDYRHPEYFRSLQARLKNGAQNRVRILGVVPRQHQLALYRCASMVMNPSLYEGWSTTVEEAIALGKRLVLSDIPLFREQARSLATFFAPGDASALADLVAKSRETAVYGPDAAAEARGRDRHRKRQLEFQEALGGALASIGFG